MDGRAVATSNSLPLTPTQLYPSGSIHLMKVHDLENQTEPGLNSNLTLSNLAFLTLVFHL